MTDHKVALKDKGIKSIGAIYDRVNENDCGQYEAHMWATLG